MLKHAWWHNVVGKSAAKVDGVYSGLRAIFYQSFVKMCSAVFVQSCWQTNQQTHKWTCHLFGGSNHHIHENNNQGFPWAPFYWSKDRSMWRQATINSLKMNQSKTSFTVLFLLVVLLLLLVVVVVVVVVIFFSAVKFTMWIQTANMAEKEGPQLSSDSNVTSER